MPNYDCKFSSGYLTAEQLTVALRAVSEVLKELGVLRVSAMYGWGSCLQIELQYVPMDIPIEALPYFIEDTLDHRIIEPGEGDLHLLVADKALELTFCHESDIHVDGEDESLLTRFLASEPFCQLDFRTAEAWKEHAKQNAPS